MPPGLATESQEAFRIQTLIATSLLVGTSGFPFMVLFFAIGHPKEALVILWSWIFFMTIPLLAKRRLTSNTLAHLLAGNYYQCHFFLALIWGGIDAPNIMWFVAMPIVSVLVGGIAHGLVWGGLTSLSVLAIYLVELLGIVTLESSLEPSEIQFVLATGTVGLLAAVLGSTAAFEVFRVRAIARRERAEAALLDSNEDLRNREQELRRSHKEVEELLVKTKAADRAKSRFLAQVSHELRTPLNGILGTSEAIQAGTYGTLTAAQSDALETLDLAAKHQLTLVNDLLDLSVVEKGALVPVMAPVCLASTLRDVSALMRDKAIQSGVTMTLFEGEDRLRIVSDERRIRQMLLNLIGNALKFTPKGGTVTLRLERRGPWVALEVQDTGIGISEEALPGIFEAFTQVDSVLQREHEGSGLGLSLTASFAKALGGELKAESVLGAGSTFTITLPYTEVEGVESAPVQSDEATEKTPQAVPDASEGLHVLLVDDTETNITHLRDFLRVKGHRVTTASDGIEAIEAAQSRPDVVFMDVQMPKMDGLEAIRRLRADPHTADLFIVSLTSFAMEEDKAKCLEAGANDYASKPVSLKRVLEFVEGQR